MADSPTFQGGTAASETLTGTAGMDVISGQGGADTLIGGDGNDFLNSGEYIIVNGTEPDYIGDRLDGGNGDDLLTGGSGSDFLIGGAGSNRLNGGDGFDTAIYAGTRDAYTVAMKEGMPAAVTSIEGGSITDTLSSVERLSFSDISIAYDIGADGNAGRTFRLYQAALNREPEAQGLGWWLNHADNGLGWENIAAGFMQSPEWAKLYGADSSDEAFIAALYRNALHREYDNGGMQYYLDKLDSGATRAQLLVWFSESPENQAAVIGQIENGIQYELFTG